MGIDTFVGIEHITANYGDDTLIGNEAGQLVLDLQRLRQSVGQWRQ